MRMKRQTQSIKYLCLIGLGALLCFPGRGALAAPPPTPPRPMEELQGKQALDLGNRLANNEDWDAACDAYLIAFRGNPSLFSSIVAHEYVFVFREAGRLVELARFFDGRMLQRMKGYGVGLQDLLSTLLGNQKTQREGYDLLERVFEFKPVTAAGFLKKYESSDIWKKAPDPVRLLDFFLIPADLEREGWYPILGNSLERSKPLYHDREALRQIATNIRDRIADKPEWVGGWALLASIEAELGNNREAIQVVRKLLDTYPADIPAKAAWRLGEVLQEKDQAFDEVVIELLELSVQKYAISPEKRSLRYSPISTLARSYARDGRAREARKLLYGLVDPANKHRLVVLYAGNTADSCVVANGSQCIACHQDRRGSTTFGSYTDAIEMSDTMTDLGYPVDSLMALARVDASFGNAFGSAPGWVQPTSVGGQRFAGWFRARRAPWWVAKFNDQKQKARERLTPRRVIEALDEDTFQRSLLPRSDDIAQILGQIRNLKGDDNATLAMRELADKFEPGRRVDLELGLDLMLSVRGEGQDADPTVFSPVIDILQLVANAEGAQAKKDVAELDQKLLSLSETEAGGLEAGIAATVFAFLRNDLESAKDRLQRLQAIRDYPESDGAAFWLVARHALKYEQTRIIGAVLAERALTAADTQPDSGLKEAILRERSRL